MHLPTYLLETIQLSLDEEFCKVLQIPAHKPINTLKCRHKHVKIKVSLYTCMHVPGFHFGGVGGGEGARWGPPPPPRVTTNHTHNTCTCKKFKW